MLARMLRLAVLKSKSVGVARLSNTQSLLANTGEVSLLIIAVVSEREEEFSDRLRTSRTFEGFTALHYALLADHLEIVRALLEAGANPVAENQLGHKPSDYARDNDVRELLAEYSTKVDVVMYSLFYVLVH